jgi:hypothetical protein
LRSSPDGSAGRASLAIARRAKHLAKAETQLGLLGWQQADFDEETQREVDKIMNVEREQARLTNEGATAGRSISELNTLREQTRRTYHEKRAPARCRARAAPGKPREIRCGHCPRGR